MIRNLKEPLTAIFNTREDFFPQVFLWANLRVQNEQREGEPQIEVIQQSKTSSYL